MKGDENIVRLLLDHHVGVNIQDNCLEKLLLASFEIGNKNVVRLLVEHNAIVNVQDEKGNTPLHQYLKEGDENLCRLLLEHNADVNIQDNNGYTALHQAVINGVVNLIGLLLEHKADVNIQSELGFTPLHLSALSSHKACNKILDLLLQHGVQNIDIRDEDGRTALQMAVRCRNTQAVKKLVDLGADVSVVKADKKDAMILERLRRAEAESVE